MTNMEHMEYLKQVALEDVAHLEHKEKTYQGSWKKRGGVGAFMMMARKWDRLEEICKRGYYDIFRLIGDFPSGEDGSVLAEIRDLRRYCLLIEAEMIARAITVQPRLKIGGKIIPDTDFRIGTPEDGGHHAGQRFGPDEDIKSPHDVSPVKVLERLEDGLLTKDIPQEHLEHYMSSPSNGRGYNIVDRNKVDQVMWEHLPRLRFQLNNKEHEESLPEYQGLYTWLPNESKWQLRSQYQKNWGKP
jgi:ribosomal protein L32E